jgi:predicted nucleotidyltransferase
MAQKEIKSCLLTGSIARGDFWPGKYGGAVDLTIFVENISKFNADEILGKDLEKNIPGHFIKHNDRYYQIKIYDEKYFENFFENHEAEQYAFLESQILFDKTAMLEQRTLNISMQIVDTQLPDKLRSSVGYANYFISEYKTDRWKRRNAITQLNKNLDSAIDLCIKALYYKNKKLSPADDRALYYSHALENLPIDYELLMEQLVETRSNNIEAYEAREKLFRDNFLSFFTE